MALAILEVEARDKTRKGQILIDTDSGIYKKISHNYEIEAR